MWACGLPYRISPKSENLRFSPCVLSAKAAVGSRPPHTEQGKNREKPILNGQQIKVSRVFNGFYLAAFEAGGHRPQTLGLKTSISRKAFRLGIKTGGVARRASNEARCFSRFLSKTFDKPINA